MCDACLLLGQPWLPELHGGRPRPRVRPAAMKLRQAKPPQSSPASVKSKRRP